MTQTTRMSTTPHNRKNALLSFHGVTTESDESYDSPVWEIDFTLSEGELMLIKLERGHFRLPIGDAAQGLIEPVNGRVKTFNEDWNTMSPDQSAAHRGKIGRVFEIDGWLGDLNISENITLSQRHHSKREEADIIDEAFNLAQYFGLPGLPAGPASKTHEADLRRASLVRALLGKPRLIILERPTRMLFPEILPPLINAVHAARDYGAAVLWLTSEVLVWNDPGMNATIKGAMYGSRMDIT